MNTRPSRLPFLDTLRGLLIILMIVEHARQMLGGGVILETKDGAGTITTDALSGGIRLLSHLCAPGFFFLLGIGMVLRTRQKAMIPWVAWRAFVSRGLAFMVLQVTLENIGWAIPVLLHGDLKALSGTPQYLGVLFGLGGSMMITASLLPRSSALLVLLATLLISSPHWSLPGYSVPWTGWLIDGFHSQSVEVLYPLLPWTGITLWGVIFARHGLREGRMGWPWICGAGFVVAMGVALWVWGGMTTAAAALIAFYKYPPSLSYTMGTVSILLLLLAVFARFAAANLPPLQLLGRHSLTLYLGHLYVLGLVSLLLPHSGAGSAIAAAAVVVLFGLWWCWRRENAEPRLHRVNRFDSFFPYYDRFMQLFRLYRTQEIKNVLTTRDAQCSLLDVGGGTGYIAAQLSDRFRRIVVVDQSEGMLEIARRRKLETHCVSALALPFTDHEFDVVMCTDALHHIKHVEQAICEMRRVLRPGGTLVIQEFHIHGLAGWLFLVFERLFVDRSEFITPAQLSALMTRYGLSGACHPISRLEYIYAGTKLDRDLTP